MLKEELKAIKSERKDLRSFGLVVGGVLLALGGVFLWRGRPAYPYLLATGSLLAAMGLALPSALKPLQRVWMALAVVMGWFMTRLILCVLFYLVITPLALAMRLSGKRFLDICFLDKGRNEKSYWVRRGPETKDPARYDRQF